MIDLQQYQINLAQEKVLYELTKKVGKGGYKFLEVGSWCGHSSVILGQVVKEYGGHLFCIDWWKGTPTAETGEIATKADIFSHFWNRICDAGLENVVIPVRGQSEIVSEILRKQLFDLVFIDADHRYEEVRKDIQLYAPLVREGGILCGHDCEGRITDFERDFLEAGKDVYFYQFAHCGVILAVGSSFDDYTINHAIWSVRSADQGKRWEPTNLTVPGIDEELRLVKIGHSGFNIYLFKDKYFALEEGIDLCDLSKIKNNIEYYIRDHKIIEACSLSDVKQKVNEYLSNKAAQDTLYNKALSLAQQGQNKDALNIYKGLLLGPSISSSLKAKAYNDIGVISFSIGNSEKAEGFFMKAIFTDILFREAYTNLTQINALKIKGKKRYKFSIIISTYNRCPELQRCIKSIRENSFYPVEMIIITDPCNDGTIEYLKKEADKNEDIFAIITTEHLGSVKCINKGFSVATGDYICLLNDDIEVMPGWDLSVVATIDDDKMAGCGISLIIYPDGIVQSPGQHNHYGSTYFPWIGDVSFKDFSYAQGKSIEYSPEIQIPRACDYGYFPIMKKECFVKVGPADEQYEHYCVDPDFGYRIQAVGYKTIYCPASVIIHYDLSKKDIDLVGRRFKKDFERFVKKWGLYDAYGKQ